MSKQRKIEEIMDSIEATKEVLSTMPKNNEKNIQKYKDRIDELQNEYEKYEKSVLSILEKRYSDEVNIEPNKEIQTLEDRLNTINNTLYLLSDEKTSYEKMELDKSIYKLGKYYKENLENVNYQINICLKKFSDIGIELSLSDFDYSTFVKEYMEIFLQELKKGDMNSDKLKGKFEEIYWKCPDIILHIELNIRNLYLKKQNSIDKYFQKQKSELLKKWNKEPKDIIKAYLELKKQKLQKVSVDKKILLDKFLSGELNSKNFLPDKIQADCLNILPKEICETLKNAEEVKNNILKFLNSLYEYKNYMNFKFIIDDVKQYYIEKDKYKKIYVDTKNKINAAEKKLKKLNKNTSSNGLFGKKNDKSKQNAQQNQLIKEIKELYKQLDLNKFYNKIYSELTDNSTLYDVLNLANCYYGYLASCIIKNNQSISQEEIDSQIQGLDDFLKNPYNTIINNVTIMEEKDIALIIKDRYKLLNFTIEKEDLNIDSIDALISTLENIKIGINLQSAGLEIKQIDELCDLKKILKIK